MKKFSNINVLGSSETIYMAYKYFSTYEYVTVVL